MGLDGLDKTEAAQREIRERGLAGGAKGRPESFQATLDPSRRPYATGLSLATSAVT